MQQLYYESLVCQKKIGLADVLFYVFRNMLYKIEAESYDGNEAVERSKGNVSKAEDTIEAAQKEINVSYVTSNC